MAESRGVGSRLAGLASRVINVSRRLGWWPALLSVCSTLGRRISVHILIVTVHGLEDVRLNVTDATAGLDARFLTAEEVMRFARDEGYWYSRSFASDALARGDRCFGVFDRERLLSYCWYASHGAPVFDDIDVAVDFPFIYAYNAHTDFAQRGRGLHIFGACGAAERLRSEGFRAVTAYIEADNVAPLIAARRMGEEFVGFVALYRRSGHVHWWMSPGCGKCGFKVTRKREYVQHSD